MSQPELPVLIRSIMREEIGAAFDKFQFDTLKTELSTCGQRLCEMEEGLESLDSRAATLEALNNNLMKENVQ